MKKQYTTDAINLKNYPLNDNDSIVLMFSKDKGLVKTIAKGTKKPKSKLGARIQMFIANRLMLNEGKNFDTIHQAESLNTFSKIRQDLDKMTYAMYIVELVNNFSSKYEDSNSNHNEIYDLLFKTFSIIANSTLKSEILLQTLKFQIKFMEQLGWGMDFQYCSTCQNELSENDVIFSFHHGGFVCANCYSRVDLGENVKIHNKIRMFLNEILKTQIDKKTKYDEFINESFVEKCFLFMKKYIDNLTSRKTKIFSVLNKMDVKINA